jgi:hypothetical protein
MGENKDYCQFELIRSIPENTYEYLVKKLIKIALERENISNGSKVTVKEVKVDA